MARFDLCSEVKQSDARVTQPSNSAISERILKIFFSDAPVLEGGPKTFHQFSRIFPDFSGNREKPSNSAISEQILKIFFSEAPVL